MDRNGLCCLNNFDPPCCLPLKRSQPLGRSSYYNGSRSRSQDTGASHGPCGPTRPSGCPAQPSLLPDAQPGQQGQPEAQPCDPPKQGSSLFTSYCLFRRNWECFPSAQKGWHTGFVCLGTVGSPLPCEAQAQ